MSSHPSRTCGALILQHRLAVGWTQEELAERAGLSTRAISDLERGVSRAPRQATLDLLAQALALTASERAELEAAAHPHGRARAEAPTPLTASDAPAGRLNAAPELPMSRPAPATIPLTDEASDAPAKAALAPSPRARGKLIAGLVSMLLVVAVLGGTVFFTGALAGRLSPPSGGKLCLATDFPTTGDGADFGKSLEQAVQLAVMQNQDLGNGYTLEFRAYNDTSATGLTNPEQGVKNVTDMVHTPCILGMVGPLGSRVAAAEMPITANAGLVMISPANTDPGLTLREYAPLSPLDFDQLHPAGKKLNYFRISPNEVFHGQLDADFTIGLRPDGLGARTAYVVADRTAYGELMAGVFTQEFLSKGGTVLGTTDSPFGSAEQLAELAASIVATRPEAVFYGGKQGSALLKVQLVQAGYTGPFVGTDGVFGDPDFLGQAGQAAPGTFASNPAPDLATFTTGAAAKFLHNYQAAYPGQNLDGYGANAYDAAMVLITAIKRLIGAGQKVTRDAVIDEVHTIEYAGVTSPIRFDNNGDNAQAVVSIYTIQGGKWIFVKQIRL